MNYQERREKHTQIFFAVICRKEHIQVNITFHF